MMALGAGIVVPNVLRWYWWRFNGEAWAASSLAGVACSVIALIVPTAPIWIVFPIICAGSLVVGLVVTFLTRPVPGDVLTRFWTTVRPFGLWGPIRRQADLPREELDKTSESAWRSILNTLLGIAVITGLYLFPMYLVGHWYVHAAVWFSIAAGATIALAFTWYPHLPPAGEK